MAAKSLRSMEGKTCIITGGNSGLGFETARALAGAGAKVYIICRSEVRGQAARDLILRENTDSVVETIPADLSDRRAIHRAAQRILEKEPQIDVLINNAAMVSSTQILNGEGIEMQFAVNYLGHFLLTHLLLPAMLDHPESRIINVSSWNHTQGSIHFDNLNLYGKYGLLRAYAQSKLATVLFTYELDRRLRKIGRRYPTVNCVDPGLNDTGIGGKQTNIFHRAVWRLRRKFGASPHIGAATQIYLASSPEVADISGRYWRGKTIAKSAPHSYRREDGARLWEVSEELCSIECYFPVFVR